MRSFSLDQGNRNTPVDSGARLAFAPPPSDTIYEINLAAGAAKRIALPDGAKFVVFSATGEFRAKFGINTVTADTSATDVTDGSASELNPAARSIPNGVSHVSLLAGATTKVTLSFYSK